MQLGIAMTMNGAELIAFVMPKYVKSLILTVNEYGKVNHILH